MFQTQYQINGEAVPDIRAWAREHGEPMVVVEWTRKSPNVFAGTMIEEAETDEMPLSWFQNMGFCVSTQGIPKEIRRYWP